MHLFCFIGFLFREKNTKNEIVALSHTHFVLLVFVQERKNKQNQNMWIITHLFRSLRYFLPEKKAIKRNGMNGLPYKLDARLHYHAVSNQDILIPHITNPSNQRSLKIHDHYKIFWKSMIIMRFYYLSEWTFSLYFSLPIYCHYRRFSSFFSLLFSPKILSSCATNQPRMCLWKRNPLC